MFAAGFLAAVLLGAVLPSAVAAVTGKNITVYPGVSIFIDDQKLNPTDVTGKPVEVFNYNGTVYLPVRAVSEALDQPVQWDGSTRSVYVGKHASTTPAAYLSQMDYFSGTSDNQFYTATTEKDNMGNTHTYCITRTFERTYLLNGQYSRLTGTLYQTYDQRSTGVRLDDQGVEIYGDGKLLFTKVYWKDDTGIQPTTFDIDLTGVLELKVIFADGDADLNWGNALSLGDVALYT